jgi:hypothetical protein
MVHDSYTQRTNLWWALALSKGVEFEKGGERRDQLLDRDVRMLG